MLPSSRLLRWPRSFAHLDFDNVPLDYVLVTIEIPDTVPTRLGDCEPIACRFLESAGSRLSRSLGECVPQELNVVLYPKAPGSPPKLQNTSRFALTNDSSASDKL